MKNFTQYSLVIFFTSLTFFNCIPDKKSNKKTILSPQDSLQMKAGFNYSYIPINSRMKIEGYLMLNGTTSYFDVDRKDTVVTLFVPVPSKKYIPLKAFHLHSNKQEQAMAVLISDFSQNSACRDTTNVYILKFEVPIGSIEANTRQEKIKLEKKNDLSVSVINDHPIDFAKYKEGLLASLSGRLRRPDYSFICRDIPDSLYTKYKPILIAKPKESGGGVIIEGPL